MSNPELADEKLGEWEVTGDYPAGIANIPGVIRVDDVASPDRLRDLAEKRLSSSPHIMKGLRRFGKDAVAIATSHGKQIIVGVGVASLVTAATVTGIVLYKHKSRAKK